MSDFVSGGWSLYVAVITIASLLACVWLLMIASRTVPSAADNTTGHVWDGTLQEFNNPLPRWWMGLFWITVIFAAVYLVAYPGLGSYKGWFGWSSAGQHEAELKKAQEAMAPVYAKFASMSIPDLAKDPEAHGVGERIFVNNCAACHGSDGRGNLHFPNLTDHDWLWGGEPEKIVETITQGRTGLMPPQAAAIGSAEDVRNVANYALSLSGSPHDDARAALGKEKFVICSACHGADGKGNQALGAPNLTDNIWLHGQPTEAFVIGQVTNGRTSVMPTFGPLKEGEPGRLTPDQIKVVAAYVWSLSNK